MGYDLCAVPLGHLDAGEQPQFDDEVEREAWRSMNDLLCNQHLYIGTKPIHVANFKDIANEIAYKKETARSEEASRICKEAGRHELYDMLCVPRSIVDLLADKYNPAVLGDVFAHHNQEEYLLQDFWTWVRDSDTALRCADIIDQCYRRRRKESCSDSDCDCDELHEYMMYAAEWMRFWSSRGAHFIFSW